MNEGGLKNQLNEAGAYIRQHFKTDFKSSLFAVLGSGFRAIADDLPIHAKLALADIPHSRAPRVDGHGAELILTTIADRQVLLQTGRLHMYEGYSAHEVVFVLRAIGHLGVPKVLLTNATGSVNPEIHPGQLVAIADQINLTGQNCLISLGEEGKLENNPFIDMIGCFAPQPTKKLCESLNIRTAVYAGSMGPTYETPAETRMLRILGADIVGMSTVQEVIAARQLSMQVLGLSLVTNMAGGLSDVVAHDHVLAMSHAKKDMLKSALVKAIEIF